jgi:hypothetical protein
MIQQANSLKRFDSAEVGANRGERGVAAAGPGMGEPPGGEERWLNRMTGLHGQRHYVDMDVDSLVRDGFVAVRQAVDAGTAAACRDLIWAAMEQCGVCQDNRGT